MVHKIHVGTFLVPSSTSTLPETFLDTEQHNNKQKQSRITKTSPTTNKEEQKQDKKVSQTCLNKRMFTCQTNVALTNYFFFQILFVNICINVKLIRPIFQINLNNAGDKTHGK